MTVTTTAGVGTETTIEVHLLAYGKVEGRNNGERLLAATPDFDAAGWLPAFRKYAMLGTITSYAPWRTLHTFNGLGVFNMPMTDKSSQVIFARLHKPALEKGVDGQQFDPALYQWALISRQDAIALGGNWRPIFDLMQSTRYSEEVIRRVWQTGSGETVTLDPIQFVWRDEQRAAGVERSVNSYYQWFTDRETAALTLLYSVLNDLPRPLLIRGLPEADADRLEFGLALGALLPPAVRRYITFATRTAGTRDCRAHFRFLADADGGEALTDPVLNLSTGTTDQALVQPGGQVSGQASIQPEEKLIRRVYDVARKGPQALTEYLLHYDSVARRRDGRDGRLKNTLRWVNAYASADAAPTAENLVQLLRDETLSPDDYTDICKRVLNALTAFYAERSYTASLADNAGVESVLNELFRLSAARNLDGLVTALIAHLDGLHTERRQEVAAQRVLSFLYTLNTRSETKIADTAEWRPLASLTANILLSALERPAGEQSGEMPGGTSGGFALERQTQTQLIAAIDPAQLERPEFFAPTHLENAARGEVLPLLLVTLNSFPATLPVDPALFQRAQGAMRRLLQLSAQDSIGLSELRQYNLNNPQTLTPSEVAARTWDVLSSLASADADQFKAAAALLNAYPDSEWDWQPKALNVLVNALMVNDANAISVVPIGDKLYAGLISYLVQRTTKTAQTQAQTLLTNWLDYALNYMLNSVNTAKARATERSAESAAQKALQLLIGWRLALHDLRDGRNLNPVWMPALEKHEQDRFTALTGEALTRINALIEGSEARETLSHEAAMISHQLLLRTIAPDGLTLFTKEAGQSADLLTRLSQLTPDQLQNEQIDYADLETALAGLLHNEANPPDSALLYHRVGALAEQIRALSADFDGELNRRNMGGLSLGRENPADVVTALINGERTPKTALGLLLWIAGAFGRMK